MKKILSLLLLLPLLLVPSVAHAQVAVDTAANSGAVLGTNTTTFPLTVANVPNRYIVLSCGVLNFAISSATYNGVAFSSIGQGTGDDGTKVDVWGIKAPATGTNNVVVNITGSNDFGCIALSLNGVDQTSPIGTGVGDGYVSSGTSDSNVTTGQVNGLIVDAFIVGYDAGTITPGAGQTTQSGPTLVNSNATYLVTTKAGAASVTTSFSWVNDFFRWGHYSVPVNPVAASSSTPKQLLLFVGD